MAPRCVCVSCDGLLTCPGSLPGLFPTGSEPKNGQICVFWVCVVVFYHIPTSLWSKCASIFMPSFPLRPPSSSKKALKHDWLANALANQPSRTRCAQTLCPRSCHPPFPPYPQHPPPSPAMPGGPRPPSLSAGPPSANQCAPVSVSPRGDAPLSAPQGPF